MTIASVPAFYNPDRLLEVYRVPYQERASQAQAWATEHQITPAHCDARRLALLLIDVQNTFCLPDFELFVGGRSGRGAVTDNQRLCQFIYENLGQITTIIPTLDTHTAAQIFHPLFWVDEAGNAPAPMTMISYDEVMAGKWRVNPAIAPLLSTDDLPAFAQHYTQQLSAEGKYP
jgi:nicotinamidase-related amidase